MSQEITGLSERMDFYAHLAFLPGKRVNLCGIYLNQAYRISGSNTESPVIVLPLEGAAEFELDGQSFLSAPGVPFVLEPNAEYCAHVSAETHLFIVQMGSPGARKPQAFPRSGDPNIARLLESFVIQMAFLKGHEHALERVQWFERALVQHCGDGSVTSLPEVHVRDERRICQAVKLINERLEHGVDLEMVASESGLSIRNLYYLMKKYTGMSPYNYCLSRRLIKARESLIRNYEEDPQIANHALRWGFNHLGRFSSYYREHFGEYPSETLECLESLTKFSENVGAVEGARSRQGVRHGSAIPRSVEISP
ncbi:AraC family transcriptional regulator [Marinobacter sp. M216]|uniref:AraC family transcriptional regulator n=1 Tax=Marinobacter albus TaxID=3030833 RepID=A0ABT7HG92_9GAMM|nr:MULTISPECIES: AraC family transcriptional regulator [unclassified Marinobacter]MBW7472851.1 AraC family transcriptional regulator [Marinobacter sp. F4218]MDK9559403.1 AraC family transcriptional regulator [Marinobacter sp. M216]